MDTYDKLGFEKNGVSKEQSFMVKIDSFRLNRTAYFFEISINDKTNVVTIREKRVSLDGTYYYVDEEHIVGVINVQLFKNEMRYELTYEFDGNNYWLIFRYHKGYLTVAKYLDNIVLEDFTVQVNDEYDFGIVNFKNIMNQFAEFCCYCGLRQGTLKRPVRERLVFHKGEDHTRFLDQFTYMDHDDHYGRLTLKLDGNEVTLFLNHNRISSLKITEPVYSYVTKLTEETEDCPENRLLVFGLTGEQELDFGVAHNYMFINYVQGNKLIVSTYSAVNGKIVAGSLKNFYSGDYMNMETADVKALIEEFLEEFPVKKREKEEA